MVNLLDSEILPSEVSRYGWRLYKAYAMQHKDVTRYWDIPTRHCALCETYQPCTYSDCPLKGENESCASGLYSKSCNTESNEAFINVCDLMIIKINEAVIKEREVKEVKEVKEKILMNYKFDKIKITVNESDDDDYPDMFTLTIEGMKEYDDLPDEYLSGYPRCYYDNDDDSFKLRCSDGYEMENDGSHDCEYGDWLYTTENAEADYFSMETVKKIVEEIEKCVERLRKINKPKEVVENLFNGLSDNVDSVTYDFNGCIVKVTRTNYEYVYKININPGEFDFKRKFAAMRKTYSFEHGSYGYDWRINEKLSSGMCNFDEASDFTVNDINKILIHVKKEVVEVKLMTASDVRELIDESELLPSEISKKKWEIYKEYVVQNKICNRYGITLEESDYNTCALCVVYGSMCNKCPLLMVGKKCKLENSPYMKIGEYRGQNYDTFISLIDNMISALDEAIEYERKVTTIMSPSEMKELLDEGKFLPSEISKIKWERAEAYVKTHKNICDSHCIPDWKDSSSCALCQVYNPDRKDRDDCTDCPLHKLNDNCYEYESTYHNIIGYYGYNNEELSKCIHKMIEVLDEAIKYEKKEKSKGDLVEIPNYSYMFNFNGVIVDSRSIGNGLFRVSISDSNHRIHNSYTIKINNESIRCHMWPDMSHKYDWYLSCVVLENLINTDKRSFNSWFGNGGLFNNGIELSREGTELLVTLVKKCAESEV